MNVVLLPVSEQDVLDKLYTACRTCYASGTPEQLYDVAKSEPPTVENNAKKIKLLNHVINSGHESVIEHQQLTFLISGVSRSLSHQLVRHRLCSYSQQSQRYCEFKDGKFDFVTPSTIQSDLSAHAVFLNAMETVSKAYAELINLGIPAEDARAVLPNACATNITMSLNLRELRHFVAERTCSCAQLEIRLLAKEMVKKTIEQLPFMKPYLGPKCDLIGYCNEDRKRSCGRKATKDIVFGFLEVYD